MTPCPESTILQDYLDGELVPAEREAFEAHLAACPDCAAELALYRAVFHRLDTLPLLEPDARLADRVLAEVMPGHPARWVRWLGWAYAGCVGASLVAIGAAILLPTPRAWLSALAAEATRSVESSMMFVLRSLNDAALRLADGAGSWHGPSTHAQPVLHTLASLLAQPVLEFTLWAAFLACGAVLWWLRPRERHAVSGSEHVGLLGI